MSTSGTHILIELYGCDSTLLNDEARTMTVLRSTIQQVGATIIAEHSHAFNPYGVTGMFLLQESHLSIHSWPENRYAAIDVYTCGDIRPDHRAVLSIAECFEAQDVRQLRVRRGMKESRSRSTPDFYDLVL